MSAISDVELVTAIEHAYRDGYRRYLSLAFGILGNVDRARDAVQEAFAQALRHRGDLREAERLHPWLCRIVVNVCRVEKRHSVTAVDPGENAAHTRVLVRVAIVSASLVALIVSATLVALAVSAWATEVAAPVPPKCSAVDTQRHATLRTGGYERYCGPGRAVVRVGGKSFTIEGGNCSGNLNRRSFGLMGSGDLRGKGIWFRLAQTNGRWYVRPGRNAIMDGEVDLPGLRSRSLPRPATAIISKDVKSATFSLGSPPRVTGSWRCR